MSDFNWDEFPTADKKKDSDFNWDDHPKVEDTGNVGIHQTLQGLTGGLSDEIAGGVEAVGKAAGVNGMGQTFSDVRLSDEGPTLDWETLRDAYTNARNKKRDLYKKQQEESPVASGVANFAGAVFSPINKLAKGMSIAKGGAVLGGINAFGMSDKEDAVGVISDTATGTALGGAMGYGIDKAIPYAAKLTGSAKDAFNKFIRNNPKANAEEIAKAAEMLGSKATPGMLNEGGMVQRLEQSLSESPSLWGRSVKNSLDDVYSKSQGAIDDLTSGAANSSISPFQIGEKAKSGIAMKVGEDLAPSSSIFQEISEQAKNIPISERGARAIQDNIAKLDDVVVGGLSGKPAYYVERLGNIRNVDQLKKLGTLLNDDIGASNGAERRILLAIKEKLRDAEESNIMRAAQEMSKVSGAAPGAGRDMVSSLKEARGDYASKMQSYRDLADTSRLGNFQGAPGFLDKIDSIPSERVGDKLFGVSNESGLQALQKQFPESYDLLKSGAIRDFKNSVTTGDKSSLAKFRTQFGNLNPETKTRLFGDKLSTGDAVSTIADSLPKNFNPSGTASQSMWSKEAIASNASDIPRFAYYKLLTSEKAQGIGKALVNKSEQMRQFANQSPQGFANLVHQLEQKSGAIDAPYNLMRDVTPKSGEGPEQGKGAAIDKDSIMNKFQGTKYHQVLQNAAQKGDQSFNAAAYVLQQRDPDFRKQLNGENK